MPSYSWLQMIRVLDGQEPGDPDVPDIPGPPLLSAELSSALAGPVTAKLCKMAIWACVAAGPLAAVW